MDEHDERTSLVRSNSLNRASSLSHNNNGYNTVDSPPHHSNNNQARTSHTPSSREDFARRDPRTFLDQVQRSLAPFQTWAANVLHGSEESSVVNWVQNARVARTFMMIINVILAVLAFLLMGVEVVEMALREPILDYLLPESELTLIVAGLTIVAGAFGFAVAYNLLVEEDTTIKGDERNIDEGRRGNGSGGNGRDSGPRTPPPPRSTDNMLGQNNDPPVVLQQQETRRQRLMFTKASTYLLNANTVFLALVLIVFTISVVQRSVHLSQMDKELNSAWTEANRHRIKHISDFELRHRCCGFNSITDRAFPPLPPADKKPPADKQPPTDKPKKPESESCSKNHAYGFQVPCKAELTKDFERWQKGIQRLLLVQMTMLLPLLFLVMTLSAIGFSKLKERKREELEDAEAQAEATAAVPVVDGRGGAQYERPLLEDVPPRNGGPPFLLGDVEAEPTKANAPNDVTNRIVPLVFKDPRTEAKNETIHKLLHYQWSYLQRMFDSKFTEGGAGYKETQIKEAKPKDSQILLRFMYTGVIPRGEQLPPPATVTFSNELANLKEACWEDTLLAAHPYELEELCDLTQ
ncbi:hypothetical protein BGZ82_002408 [Podila clonocystis]|nr:hypothetical protein BGZ82_002408 [Podila clonocystis]